MACGLTRGRVHPHILVGCSVLMSWIWDGGEATNVTNTTNTTTAAPGPSTTAIHNGPVTFNIADTIPQIVLTMIVVACAIIIGVVIGKVAEWMYDRHMANRDDISDISEHTRAILKANVARMKNNKDDPAENDTNAQDKSSPNKRTLLSVWTTSKRTSLVTPSPREPETNNDIEITTPQIQVTNIDDDTSLEIVDEIQNKNGENSNSGNGEETDDKSEAQEAGKENEKPSDLADEVNNNSGNKNQPIKLEDMENEETQKRGDKSSNDQSQSIEKSANKDDETVALSEVNKGQINDEKDMKTDEDPGSQSAETSKL